MGMAPCEDSTDRSLDVVDTALGATFYSTGRHSALTAYHDSAGKTTFGESTWRGWNQGPEHAWRNTQKCLAHFQEEVMDGARSLSPPLSPRGNPGTQKYEYPPPIPKHILDLRNHKYWHVNLEYRHKPTNVNGYWHWPSSFSPCTQLFDLPRPVEMAQPVISPRDTTMSLISQDELSPRSWKRRQKAENIFDLTQSGSLMLEEEQKRLRREQKGRKIPSHMGGSARDLTYSGYHASDSGGSNTRPISDSFHSLARAKQAHPHARTLQDAKAKERLYNLEALSVRYNDKKWGPGRRDRRLTRGMASSTRSLPIIQSLPDSLGPIRRDGNWWKEPKPTDAGWRRK